MWTLHLSRFIVKYGYSDLPVLIFPEFVTTERRSREMPWFNVVDATRQTSISETSARARA